MFLTLVLTGFLQEFYGNKKTNTIEVRPVPGQKLKEILQDIGINPLLVSIVVVDSRRVDLDYVPLPGERIYLIPPLSGG